VTLARRNPHGVTAANVVLVAAFRSNPPLAVGNHQDLAAVVPRPTHVPETYEVDRISGPHGRSGGR
jgi:hypothetical protein